MTRQVLVLAVATALTAASSLALAQNPNDGPKYPNMETHKQYAPSRNLDHNNPSPRYPGATANKQFPASRNLDHNNPSPRYATTTPKAGATAAPAARVHAAHHQRIDRNPG